MNENAKENHTMRNALLLVGGTAAIAGGSMAGVKALEKAIIANGKKAGTKAEKAVAKSINKDAERDMIHTAATSDKRKAVRGLDRGKAYIKKENNTSAFDDKIKTMSAKDKIKEVTEVRKFLESQELQLKMFEEANDVANIIKTKKLIGQLRQRIASLNGFIS